MRRMAALVVFALAMSLLGTAAKQEVVGQDGKRTVEAVGDVLYPGAYPLTPGLTAVDLLTAAGGSPKDTVHSLITWYDKTGQPQMTPFNAIYLMRPGDVLIVRGVMRFVPTKCCRSKWRVAQRLAAVMSFRMMEPSFFRRASVRTFATTRSLRATYRSS